MPSGPVPPDPGRLIESTKMKELINALGKEFDQIYIEEIKSRVLDSDAIIRQKDLKIVFSSIHGTGITLVPQALEQIHRPST